MMLRERTIGRDSRVNRMKRIITFNNGLFSWSLEIVHYTHDSVKETWQEVFQDIIGLSCC